MFTNAKCLARTGRRETRFKEAPRYDEGLYEVGAGVYAWMVPNGSWGETNCGLIASGDCSLLVDTPWDLHFSRQMTNAMRVVTDRCPVRTVVNTHSDGDHFWGNQLFRHEEIIASVRAAAAMNHVSPATLEAMRKLGRLIRRFPTTRARRVGTWFSGMTAPYDFSDVVVTRPNREFSGELTLNLGGRTIVLRELGPAHTDGDTVVFVEDAKVLFTGDLMFVDSTPVIWAGPAENWISALDTILDYDATVIVPGHGPLASRDHVLAVRGYLEFVSGIALERHRRGVPPKQVARELASMGSFSDRGFAQWDSPERIMTTVHSIYRSAGYAEGPGGALGTLRVMAAQAELAFEMPGASPSHMHRLP